MGRRIAVVLWLTWFGCASDPAQEDPGPAILQIDRTVADFGDASLGSVTAPTAFVITNTGGTTATLHTDSDSGSFPIASNTCDRAELAPGHTCSIAFTFAPSRAGIARADLTVTATGTSVGASLIGNGLADAMIAISPTAQDLGPIVEGQASTAFAFVVTNTGGIATGLLELQLTGNEDFLVTADSCSHEQIAPGATCTLGVTFEPTAAGARSAAVTLAGTPGGTAKATLGGHGLAPSTLVITPASHDFQIADVGAAPATSSLVVTNTGDEPSGALATSYFGPADLGIVSDACTTHSLGSGASCTITTRFAPSTWGAMHATVMVDPVVGSTVTASLAGTGRDAVPLSVVAIAGNGSVSASGAATHSGNSIDCPSSSCSEAYLRTLASPMITLVARPDANYHFDHWSGGPCDLQGATCTFALATTTSVTATFAIDLVPLTITIAGTGSASSSVPGMAPCTGICTTNLAVGTQLTLTASAGVARWNGACSGAGPTCTITVFGPTQVGLAFTDCSGELRTDADTVALWHLNDGGGQVVHDAAGHFDGTLGKDNKVADDDPLWVTGRFGGALYFDATSCPVISDEHCEWLHVLTTPLAFPDGFSLEMWVEPTGILSNTTIDYDDGSAPRLADLVSTETSGTLLTMTGGNQLRWLPPGGPYTFASTPLANAWHSIAATYDGAASRIYVDGVLVDQAAGAFTPTTVGNFDIGGVPFDAFLNGYIDEIRISSVARTSADIANAYATASVCPQ